MAVKRVVIPRSELPAVNSDNQHIIRFRVISDDRNSFSDWSPVISVPGSTIEPNLLTVESFSSGRVVTVVIEDISSISAYDLFAKFDNNPYFYVATSSSNTAAFINRANSNYRFALQVESIEKTYNESLKIYESDLIDVV